MDEENKGESIPKWFWWTGAAIVVLWIVALVVPYLLFQDLQKQGEFGDAFGSVNALFSGFAFLGVILALYLQRQDLKIQSKALKMQNEELQLQRKELVQTREEIKGQKEEMSLQRETMQRQQFEATFFQMLRLFDDYRKGIRRNDREGIEALKFYKGTFQNDFAEFIRSSGHLLPDSQELGDQFANRYRQWDILGPYFHLFKNICLYIDNARMDQKEIYWTVLREYLTPSEAVLILSYCSVPEENPELKIMIEGRGLLKSITRDEWWPGIPHNRWKESAFMGPQYS